MSMLQLTNARGETVDLNSEKLFANTPTGLGVQFTNTYSQYETYFKATKSTVTQGQFQIYILFGDVESQAYQTFSDFAQFLAYQPLTLTYTTDSGTWYRDGRLNSLTKTEIGGSTVFATDRINESFTLEFINNWYNNKTAEYKSYDPDPNLGTYGKIYNKNYNPLMVDRNYILVSSGLNTSSTSRPVLIGAVSGGNTTVTYPTDGVLMTNNQAGEWYYQLANAYTDITTTPLIAGQTYTLSLKAMGTAPQVALRWGSKEGSPAQGFSYTNINNTAWTKATITFTIPTGTLNVYLRIQGAVNNQATTGFSGGETIKFKEVKLESGTIATDWTPAPEDNPVIPFRYAYAPYYVYIEAKRNSEEKVVSLINKSQYFGLQNGSPCVITISSTNETISPSWSVIKNGSIVATDRMLLILSKNQRLVVSSYPEDQYARVYNPDGSYADVSQLQDFTKTNFVQIPEGESTVLFYVDNQATVNLTFKEERLLV